MNTRIVAELDAVQTEVDALKRLQAGTSVNNTGQAAAGLDALLPAFLDKTLGETILSPANEPGKRSSTTDGHRLTRMPSTFRKSSFHP